jgi:phospholipase C
LWPRTLLIITCDEHGGCYDHVPPPPAVAPNAPNGSGFGFDRYGVRVPAVLVSPWIAPHTILRTPDTQAPFDHTSIIATLSHRWNFPAALTPRVAAAPHLEAVLNLVEPSNNGPASIMAPPYTGTNDDLQRALKVPLNDFQRALHEAAGHLPDCSHLSNLDERVRAVADKIRTLIELRLQVSQGRVAPIQASVAALPSDALAFIRTRLRAALGLR